MESILSNMLLEKVVLHKDKIQENNDGSSIPKIDFKSISEGIVSGGADVIFNRFNLGTTLTTEDAKTNLIKGLVNAGAYFHQLAELGTPENFGVYFEVPSIDMVKNNRKQLTFSQNLLLKSWGKEELEVSDATNNPIQYAKVPDRYKILNDLKWSASMAAWDVKEFLRMSVSPIPISKGVIVIDKYIYTDKHNIRGKSVIKYAVAVQSEHINILENITSLSKYATNVKMFDTSFLSTKEKKLNDSMSRDDVRSVTDIAKGLSYNFKIEGSPFILFNALGNKYGLKAFAGGFLTYTDSFNPDIYINPVPGIRLHFEGENGESLFLKKDEFNKDEYKIRIDGLYFEKSIDLLVDFTNNIAIDGARFGKTDYNKMFSDIDSIYLPTYPMANKNTISLDYPGDLSPLNK